LHKEKNTTNSNIYKSILSDYLTEIILEKHGGFLFDGVRLDAPADFKKPIV